ncbi:MAG: AAA family ATPase [Cetobacterium sp.]|uniref:AAA family ATPase n=1 Tax=Cetobacterium sp. TaxID=2071632 RepID=UPI003F34CC39
MNTEVLKIIEGGLKGDKDKVFNYAQVLSSNLKKNGDERFANRINTILSKNNNLVGLDSLSSKPVDQESRLNIVDISMPHKESKLYFNHFIDSEVNDFIKSYHKQDELKKIGIEAANSLLLYGPPGCGKTSLAKFISYQTNLPLVTARLDVLLSSLLGSTAKNIRKVFEYASKRPCILFLDEFDAIAKIRNDKNELGELKRIVNSLLQNIDEFSSNSILIAATNHHEVLDAAVWRRFMKIIELGPPEVSITKEILDDTFNNIEVDITDINKKINLIISSFEGMSPSDIKNVVNSAIRKAILNGTNKIKPINILYEVYLFRNHSIKDENKLVIYLNENGITQKEINEFLGISMRKIRDLLK